MKQPKNYSQFERATELCHQIAKECPNVSVVLNCNIQSPVEHLFGVSSFNKLKKTKDAIIQPDKTRQFIVFNHNTMMCQKTKKK